MCQHDLELVYAGYGYTSTAKVTDAGFFGKHITTGLHTNPGSVTVEATQQVTVSATSFEFLRSGGQNPSAVVPSGLALQWQSEVPGIASVVPPDVGTTARIHGEAPGGTQVYLDVTNPATLPPG